MAILPQTKDAIGRLKAFGLKRSEFRAQCERIMSGSTFRGYGDVSICLLCPLDRQRNLAPVLAQEFHVVQYTIDGVPKGAPHVSVKGKPGLFFEEV